MAKKKTTKKTTKKTADPSPRKTTRTNQPSSTPPARTTAPAEPPKPRLVPQPPPAAPKQREPVVPVEDYVHMQARIDTFLADHPGAVYFQLAMVSREENERALASLDDATPIFVCTPMKPGSFTARDLENLGFLCFQNGKGGQLVGTKVQ